jgi:hypothetical protein
MYRNGNRRASLCALILGLVVLCSWSGCTKSPDSSQANSGSRFATMVRRWETTGPLVQFPQTLTAEDAEVEDSAWVIGVSVKGRHRAYRMRGMKLLETHVVNDLIEQVPVTVTYCDLRACIRGFTAPNESEVPLTVRVGGFDDRDGLMLTVDGQLFAQAADETPLTPFSVETMSWKEWKSAHPDTDIYMGREIDPEAENNVLRNLAISTPGVKYPAVVSAANARLIDAAKVIGVTIHGKHRAYRITALSDPRSTVLNDVIDGVPVTVTFNYWKGTIRVFTKGEGDHAPLGVGLRGWEKGTMLLTVDGQIVPQDSDQVDLDELETETVSWKEWKTAHPDTDVYTGMELVSQAAD